MYEQNINHSFLSAIISALKGEKQFIALFFLSPRLSPKRQMNASRLSGPVAPRLSGIPRAGCGSPPDAVRAAWQDSPALPSRRLPGTTCGRGEPKGRRLCGITRPNLPAEHTGEAQRAKERTGCCVGFFKKHKLHRSWATPT